MGFFSFKRRKSREPLQIRRPTHGPATVPPIAESVSQRPSLDGYTVQECAADEAMRLLKQHGRGRGG
jgi:hypothetical protein